MGICSMNSSALDLMYCPCMSGCHLDIQGCGTPSIPLAYDAILAGHYPLLRHKHGLQVAIYIVLNASRTMQDVAAGDGTTSVTVICGALLRKCLELLERGVHPTVISDSFAKAVQKAEEILQSVAVPVDLKDRECLIKAANTYVLYPPIVHEYSRLYYTFAYLQLLAALWNYLILHCTSSPQRQLGVCTLRGFVGRKSVHMGLQLQSRTAARRAT